MLDLKLLTTFREVAVRGSFSDAATALDFTQPAVSQHISRLEATLGVRVLERNARGVSLTPAGEVLVRHASALLDAARRAEEAVREAAGIGRAHGLLGLTGGIEQRAGMAHEDLAGGGQRHTASAALEHPHAERGLQTAYVLRHGRLREVEGGGGIRERAAHRDLAESGEELEVEHHGTLCQSTQVIIGHDRLEPAPWWT